MQAEADSSHAILDSIRQIVRALRVSSRQAEQELGLSGAQLLVLQKLAEDPGGLTLNDLAARTLTHQSSVSTVVSRLVERGYVQRQASSLDRRCLQLRLTPKGRVFLGEQAPRTAQERLFAAVASMPKRRQQQLAALLRTVIETAGFAGEEPTMFFEDPPPRRGREGPPPQPRRRKETLA